MSNLNNDPNLPHREPTDTRLDARPTRDVYVDRDGDGFAEDRVRTDTAYTGTAAHKSGTNWGKIALVAAAVILGLALLSALFTGAEDDAADLATAPVVIEEDADLAVTDEALIEETNTLATAPLAVENADPVATGTITEDDALILENETLEAAPVEGELNTLETETTIVPLTN